MQMTFVSYLLHIKDPNEIPLQLLDRSYQRLTITMSNN